MSKRSLLQAVASMMVMTVSTVAVAVTGTSTNANAPKIGESSHLPKTTLTAKSADMDKASYSLGYFMGDGNKDSVDDLRLDPFFQGFRDAYLAKNPAFDKTQMQKILLDYQKRKETEYAKKIEAAASKNLAKEKAFLATNGKKASVKATASGLQYEVLKQGTGKMPTAKDKVKVHYEGRLLDGTIFDSSYKRGEPVIFPLEQVITGWTEGLQLMKEGSKYRLYVPSSLGYGEAGNSDIEPNSLLIFDVELLEVNPKATVKK